MKTKIFSLSEFTDKTAVLNNYRLSQGGNNSEARKNMYSLIQKVAQGELTERQKYCFFMYYQKNMNMKEISVILGITVSCVSRHIKKAKLKIKKMVSYYDI